MIELLTGPFGGEILFALVLFSILLGLAPFAVWEVFKAWRAERVRADQREHPNAFPPLVVAPLPTPFGILAKPIVRPAQLAEGRRAAPLEEFSHLTMARRQAD